MTVATNSREQKKIMKYLQETGDPEQILFKLHDFDAEVFPQWKLLELEDVHI